MKRRKGAEGANAIKPRPVEHPTAEGPESAKLGRLFLQSLLSSEWEAAPTVARVAGAYRATLFASVEGGILTNHLTHGSRLEVVLNVDGTSTGLLWVTDAAAGGRGYNISLVGQWTLQGDTVQLDLKKDVFVSEMLFVFHDGVLEAEQLFGARVTRIVLAKRGG